MRENLRRRSPRAVASQGSSTFCVAARCFIEAGNERVVGRRIRVRSAASRLRSRRGFAPWNEYTPQLPMCSLARLRQLDGVGGDSHV